MRAGQQLARFLDARADGSTLCRATGSTSACYTDAGNLTQRRSHSDPSGLGRYPGVDRQLAGQPAHPLQPLLGRRGRDARGIRRASASPGTASAGSATRPTTRPDSAPDAGLGAFIMLPEGVARLFVPGQFVDGPWSEHYEPVESPVANPLHPDAQLEPGRARLHHRVRRARQARRVSDRLHDLPADRALPLLDEEQSRTTCSSSRSSSSRSRRSWRARRASRTATWCASPRPAARSRAARWSRGASSRCRSPASTVYQIGFPIHWGFLGRGQQRGSLANLVTPTGRRSELVRAGVQGLPGEAGEGVRTLDPNSRSSTREARAARRYPDLELTPA